MELTLPIDPSASEPATGRSRGRDRGRKGGRKSGSGSGGGRRGPQPPKKPPPRAEDHDFPAGIRWSLIAHGAALIILIVKGLIFPGEPAMIAPTLRVDMVGLPEILKKDLQDVSRTPPGIQDALKNAEEAAKQELARQKEMAAKEREAEAEAAAEEEDRTDPDELVLQAKKKREAEERKKREAEEKTKREKLAKEAKDRRERERRTQNALDRLKALSKLESEKSETAKEPGNGVVIKGNRLSGGASLDPAAREGMESSYYERVRNRLVENWALPIWLTRQNLQAKVVVFIDERGRLSNFQFTKNSGNETFDEAVRKTLRDSQPYPLPPAEIAPSLQSSGILVGFPL
jgi:outer membrane biosynthesis protein TonB